jgi:hypothetical protein
MLSSAEVFVSTNVTSLPPLPSHEPIIPANFPYKPNLKNNASDIIKIKAKIFPQ